MRERRGGAVRGLVLVALGALGCVAAGALGALVFTERLWLDDLALPAEDDLVDLKRLFRPEVEPPRLVYLHRGPVALAAGRDASDENRSSVLLVGELQRAELPGFSGGDRAWQAIVRCVREQFSPFAVEVTDRRPPAAGYVMVVFAGAPGDIGIKRRAITGLAPFTGGVIPDPVVFAFGKSLRGDLRATCETIAMEVAHAYGLDHAYLCQDVMSYLGGCGPKRFVDRDAACGEHRRRRCASAVPTQNSYRRLLEVLGPRGRTETRTAAR